jgi:hypothetical protein
MSADKSALTNQCLDPFQCLIFMFMPSLAVVDAASLQF